MSTLLEFTLELKGATAVDHLTNENEGFNSGTVKWFNII